MSFIIHPALKEKIVHRLLDPNLFVIQTAPGPLVVLQHINRLSNLHPILYYYHHTYKMRMLFSAQVIKSLFVLRSQQVPDIQFNYTLEYSKNLSSPIIHSGAGCLSTFRPRMVLIQSHPPHTTPQKQSRCQDNLFMVNIFIFFCH